MSRRARRYSLRCPLCGASMLRLRVNDEQIGRFRAWACGECDLLTAPARKLR